MNHDEDKSTTPQENDEVSTNETQNAAINEEQAVIPIEIMNRST